MRRDMGASVEFGILGPLEVRVDRVSIGLGGRRKPAVLAVLLCIQRVVATERLVDLLWGERPPSAAMHATRVCVSRLRAALGPAAGRLLTESSRYLLEADQDEDRR